MTLYLYDTVYCIDSNDVTCDKNNELLSNKLIKTLENFFHFHIQHTTVKLCQDILTYNVSVTSGFYHVLNENGFFDLIYCEAKSTYHYGKSSLARVGYLNMSEFGATCHPGLTL